MKKEEEYKNYYSHLNSTFIKSTRQFDIYENYFRKNILEYLPENKTAKITDIGCGVGHFLYFLKKENFSNISGFDLVKENVQICINNSLVATQDDLFDYIYSTKEKSDVFVLNNILEHFFYEEIIKIINSLYNLLNTDGKIIIIIPNCNNIHGLATYFSDITHKSPLNEKSFEDLIKKTNFSRYTFHNLIVYPDIFLIDSFVKYYNKLLFLLEKVINLLNGQKPFKVHSKNLLAILQK